LEIVKADKDGSCPPLYPRSSLHSNLCLPTGYVKTYIILPSTVYGIATGKIADLGVQHLHSIQLPVLVRASLARGQAAIVGEGKNIWPNVEIGESMLSFVSSELTLFDELCTLSLVADLYIVLYDSIVSNPATAHGRQGFYFGENGEYTQYEAAKAISEALLAYGKVEISEPTALTEEEYKERPLVNGLIVLLRKSPVTESAPLRFHLAHLFWHECSLSCRSLSIYRLEAG
jgi:hypothetical protein